MDDLIAKPSTAELHHGGYNRLRTTRSKTGPYTGIRGGIVVGGSCSSLVLASRRSALLASASSVTRRSVARPDLIGHRIHRRSAVYGPGQDGVGVGHACSVVQKIEAGAVEVYATLDWLGAGARTYS
jgi:hypothetical protein